MGSRSSASLDGFLNLWKPKGPTSNQVVQWVRRWSGAGRVGHGGTLDPDAEGILPIGLGYATRLLEFIPPPKVYRASVLFGVETDTYDASGTVVARREVTGLDRAAVEAASRQFVGSIMQRPPRFSALKRDGERLYRLARQGIAVEVAPRQVEVFRLELLAWEPPVALLEVECGPGTYIRSIAYELGQALGCGAHLNALERTRVGEFVQGEHITVEAAQDGFSTGQGPTMLLPLDFPVRHWPSVQLSQPQTEEALQGKELSLSSNGEAELGMRCAAYGPSGTLVALLQRLEAGLAWHPFKAFPPK